MITALSVRPIGENVYIVDIGNGRCVIVDPGAEPERILSSIGSLEPVCIALTHGHLDHCAALPELKKALGSVSIAIHSADARYLGATGEEANRRVFTDIGSLDFFHHFWSPMPEADILLADGDCLPGTSIVTMHTPGHTAGSCCFYVESEDALISGDTLFQGGIGRTDTFDASEEAILESIRFRILTLPPRTRVYPGHGGTTTIAAERPYYS